MSEGLLVQAGRSLGCVHVGHAGGMSENAALLRGSWLGNGSNPCIPGHLQRVCKGPGEVRRHREVTLPGLRYKWWVFLAAITPTPSEPFL